jgi:hypothetical protein
MIKRLGWEYKLTFGAVISLWIGRIWKQRENLYVAPAVRAQVVPTCCTVDPSFSIIVIDVNSVSARHEDALES